MYIYTLYTLSKHSLYTLYTIYMRVLHNTMVQCIYIYIYDLLIRVYMLVVRVCVITRAQVRMFIEYARTRATHVVRTFVVGTYYYHVHLYSDITPPYVRLTTFILASISI